MTILNIIILTLLISANILFFWGFFKDTKERIKLADSYTDELQKSKEDYKQVEKRLNQIKEWYEEEVKEIEQTYKKINDQKDRYIEALEENKKSAEILIKSLKDYINETNKTGYN